jgi:hypothetical protein
LLADPNPRFERFVRRTRSATSCVRAVRGHTFAFVKVRLCKLRLEHAIEAPSTGFTGLTGTN